jgi:hypothetical protein
MDIDHIKLYVIRLDRREILKWLVNTDQTELYHKDIIFSIDRIDIPMIKYLYEHLNYNIIAWNTMIRKVSIDEYHNEKLHWLLDQSKDKCEDDVATILIRHGYLNMIKKLYNDNRLSDEMRNQILKENLLCRKN